MGILSYKPQANDNIFKFIFGTVKHHYEVRKLIGFAVSMYLALIEDLKIKLWPLVGSLAIWAVIVSSAITWNASKQDVW